MQDNDTEIQQSALKMLHHEVLSIQGTAGFNQQELFDRIETFKSIAQGLSEYNRKYLYDLLSVINMFYSDQNVIKFRLMGSVIEIQEWDLQYVRKLVCCILVIIHKNLESDDYSSLIQPITHFLFQHNSEIEDHSFIIDHYLLQLLFEKIWSLSIMVVAEVGIKISMLTEYFQNITKLFLRQKESRVQI